MVGFFIINYICLIAALWSKIPIKLYFLWMMAIFSIVAFIYDPFLQARISGTDGVDLCRHFDTLDMIRLGLTDSVYIEAPLSALYLNLIAYLFDNNHFLPVISLWIYYGIYFFVMNKFLSYTGVDEALKFFSIGLCILCDVFFWSMDNIRYPIAIMLFSLVLYYDTVSKAKTVAILYILPILMHPGILILLSIRIMAKFKFIYSVILLSLLGIIMTQYYESILMSAISVFASLPDIQSLFLAISMKSINYSTESVYDIPLIYRVLNIYITLCLFFVYCLARNIGIDNNIQIKILCRMTLLTVFLSTVGTVANFMEGNFTARILSIAPVFLTVLAGNVLLIYKQKSLERCMYIKVFLFCILLPYMLVYIFKIYPNWIYSVL